MLPKKRIGQFQELILDWYSTNQRDLPWRHTHDPYAILVSEVMLQQTQVDRVKNYWTAWLNRWPTFEALAAARAADVIRAWAGLGYNRRAVNLQRAARYILDHGGFSAFTTPEKLVSIPGVGPGTAGALMNFVWNIDTPFLEVNLKRIFQRLAFGPETVIGWQKDKDLLVVANAVLPTYAARIWPHALMDFGALACRPNDPFCEHCPLGAILPPSRLKVKTRPNVLVKKTKPRFETTNRYWRGRILDVLRKYPMPSKNELYQLLPTDTSLEPGRYEELLKDLQRDGLIRETKNSIHLP